MIGIDTNVLIRYVVGDEPEQSATASEMIERTIDGGETLFISQIVLCEFVWVLSHAYRFTRDEIVDALQQVRRSAQMTIEGADEVRRATEAYAVQRGDFADYIIAERCMASGCSSVATFDRVLHADQRFAAPDRIR
ncbi:MAG: type II toxin-antitoxin system VapC family toxin [Acidobacteriota bacterium]|nr:type II toxin-antitoxin system VapC family toxin [Acidobacteriota bacterium]